MKPEYRRGAGDSRRGGDALGRFHAGAPRFLLKEVIMDHPSWEQRIRDNARAAVWGLKKTILAKREEIVDLELQLDQARARMRELDREAA